MNANDIRPEWLRAKLDSHDLAPAMRIDLEDAGLPPPVAAQLASKSPAKLRDDWAAFVSHLIADDEVWFFKRPSVATDGRAGFVIVRAGVPVHVFLTRIS